MKTWTWLLIVAAGCGVAAVNTLPPREMTSIRFPPSRTPERRAANRLIDEMKVDVERLRRLEWTDVELGALSATDQPVTIGAPSGAPPERIAALSTLLNAELARLGASDPQVRLGVFARGQEGSMGIVGALDPRRMQMIALEHSEWYAGALPDGQPYCITLRVAEPDVARDLSIDQWRALGPDQFSNILGPCGFYARYGMPGRGTSAWLDQTMASFALARMRPGQRPTRVALPKASVLFGAPSGNRSGLFLPVQSCLKGDTSFCEHLASERTELTDMFEFASVRGEGVPLIGYDAGVNSGNPFYNPGQGLLDHLEQTYGPDAFAKFWKSDRPVAEAFEDAFGAPLGPWMRDWAREQFGGPGTRFDNSLTWSQAVWTLACMALVAWIAVAVCRRRELA